MTDKSNTQAALITKLRRAAEDAIAAANPRFGPFVDAVARPLDIIALCNAAQPTPEPVTEGLVVVDMVPPATARDRWMYEQGRLAERDARTHAIEAAPSPVALEGRDERWKVGNEFAPFHKSASHINPDYRDGWNACYEAARASLPAGGVVEPVAWLMRNNFSGEIVFAARDEKPKNKAVMANGKPAWTDAFPVYATPQPSETSTQPRPSDDKPWDQTLQERDSYHKWADRLAAAIAAHTGVDIGEHSNVNNPWQEALDALPWQPSETQGRRQMTDAARDVLAERERQISAEGWTPDHDDGHDPGELAAAGAAYAIAAADEIHPLSQGDGGFDSEPPPMWPWSPDWWKPGGSRRMLVKACALGLAEIERLDRKAGIPASPQDGGEKA